MCLVSTLDILPRLSISIWDLWIVAKSLHCPDHTVHHVLSLYGVAASPTDIQRAYDNNSTYQRPARVAEDRVKNQEDFEAKRGKLGEYANFLTFFQGEISEKGVGSVVNEYLFSRTELAEDMLVRLFGGMLTSMFHFLSLQSAVVK